MKILNHLHATGGGMVKRTFLMVLSVSILLLVSRDVVWLYASFESEMGTRMAQAAISYHMVLLLGMLSVGIGMGHLVNRMIREKRSIFRSPRKGGKTELLMKLWGYQLKKEEPTAQTETATMFDPPIMEPFDLFQLPSRRGRKPTFTLEHWLPIAMKWEHRDPTWDAFTLAELIAEHLGTNPDGSPIISEQTYYSVWRKRAISEMQRRAANKTAGTTAVRKKEGV